MSKTENKLLHINKYIYAVYKKKKNLQATTVIKIHD